MHFLNTDCYINYKNVFFNFNTTVREYDSAKNFIYFFKIYAKLFHIEQVYYFFIIFV